MKTFSDDIVTTDAINEIDARQTEHIENLKLELKDFKKSVVVQTCITNAMLWIALILLYIVVILQ